MIKMQKMSQIWLNEIIPNWTEKRKDKKIKEYFYMGLPDNVRGKVWMLCLGNKFSITKEYYEIQVKNCKETIEKYKSNKNEERQSMSQELDNKNNDILNLNSQIRGEINDINNLQNQLNKNNGLSLQYESNIKDYQRQLDFLKRDNDNLKNNIYKEKGINSEESQKNKELSNILEDRDQTINQLTQDIENIKIMQQNEENKNNLLQDENTKLRNHIMTLTEQNQNLINEIDCVIEEDEKAKYILDRKKRISSVLLTNRNTIDQSLNNLDECINKRNINYENSNTPISRSKFSYEFQ